MWVCFVHVCVATCVSQHFSLFSWHKVYLICFSYMRIFNVRLLVIPDLVLFGGGGGGGGCTVH